MKKQSESELELKEIGLTKKIGLTFEQSIAQLIMNTIIYNDFKPAEEATIKVPFDINYEQKEKRVSHIAAKIFKECSKYSEAKDLNTDNFENFLADQINILKQKPEISNSIWESIWKKRSQQIPEAHKNLLSLLENQYEALIFFKTANKTVKDIQIDCLERIIEATRAKPDSNLQHIRSWAKSIRDEKNDNRFDQLFCKFCHNAKGLSTSIIILNESPNAKIFLKLTEILNNTNKQIARKEKQTQSITLGS